jgi:hypothetical protein
MTQPQYSSPPLVRSGEQLLGNFIQIGGQRLNLPNPAALLAQTALAVFVKRDLQFRRDTILLRFGEFVDDAPELAFGLFDEALHAAAGVEQDGDLHERLRGFFGGRVWSGFFRAGEIDWVAQSATPRRLGKSRSSFFGFMGMFVGCRVFGHDETLLHMQQSFVRPFQLFPS